MSFKNSAIACAQESLNGNFLTLSVEKRFSGRLSSFDFLELAHLRLGKDEFEQEFLNNWCVVVVIGSVANRIIK